jgi:type II secretory pathway component PulF
MSTIPSTANSSSRSPATILVVALHALFWTAWLAGLLLWVPRVERVFRDFNVKPPLMAELAITLTHGIVPLGLLLVLLFVLADGTVAYRLRRSGARALWSGLMTIAPVAAIIVTALALILPMVQLLEMIHKAYSN